MVVRILAFLNAYLAALVVGAMFGIWLIGNVTDLSPEAYTQNQQNAIRALNLPMPVLGGVATLLTLVSAVFARRDRLRFLLLIGATGCFLAAGAITRFCNQPLNAVVMTWSPDAPPGDWAVVRDVWWRWHVRRSALGITGLALLQAAGSASHQSRIRRPEEVPGAEGLP